MSTGRSLAVLALIALGMAPPAETKIESEKRERHRRRPPHKRSQYVARLQARARRRSR